MDEKSISVRNVAAEAFVNTIDKRSGVRTVGGLQYASMKE
jgi:hypothetical protein